MKALRHFYATWTQTSLALGILFVCSVGDLRLARAEHAMSPSNSGNSSSRAIDSSSSNPYWCYGLLNADDKKQLQEELANIYSNYRNNEEKLKSALGRYLERHVGPDGGGKKGVETIALAAEAFKKFKEVSQFSDALSSLSRGEKVSDPSLSKKIENIKADYETLAKAGFKFDPKEQKWDLSGVSQWTDLSQQNSSLKTAISNLISPDASQKLFDPERKQSLELGGMVFRPPIKDYGSKKVLALTKDEQDKDVEKEISKFMDYKGDYIRASKESNTYGNLMTGKIWEMVGYERGHDGKTAPEIERDGSLKRMSDSIKFMKETLGVEHSAVAPLYSSLHRAIDVDSAGLAALDKDLTQKINTLKTTAYVLGAAAAVAVTGGLAAPAVFSAAVVGASGTITAAAGTALAFQAIPAAINIGIDVASGKSVSCAAMDELSKRGINAVSSAVIAGAMGAGGSALSGGIAQIPGRAGQFAQGAMALPGLYFAGQGALGVVNNGRLTYNMLEEAKQAEKRGESARAAELRIQALKLGAETAINLGESLYGATRMVQSFKDSRYTADMAKAREVLGIKDFTRRQKDAIERAHRVGDGQLGADGVNPAQVNNYTWGHKREKLAILKEAGFSTEDIRKLMKAEVVGRKNDFTNSYNRGDLNDDNTPRGGRTKEGTLNNRSGGQTAVQQVERVAKEAGLSSEQTYTLRAAIHDVKADLLCPEGWKTDTGDLHYWALQEIARAIKAGRKSYY